MSESNNPFQIHANSPTPQARGEAHQETDRSRPAKERIEAMIGSSDIFIFMKGTPDQPQCGFSYNTVEIMRTLNHPFRTFDVLSDPDIRQGVKEFSNWPTIPQIYIKGNFVGGNDIITELKMSGELDTLVGSNV